MCDCVSVCGYLDCYCMFVCFGACAGVIKHTPKDNRYYNYVNNDNDVYYFRVDNAKDSCRFLVAGRVGDGGVTRILNRRARGTVAVFEHC